MREEEEETRRTRVGNVDVCTTDCTRRMRIGGKKGEIWNADTGTTSETTHIGRDEEGWEEEGATEERNQQEIRFKRYDFF